MLIKPWRTIDVITMLEAEPQSGIKYKNYVSKIATLFTKIARIDSTKRYPQRALPLVLIAAIVQRKHELVMAQMQSRPEFLLEVKVCLERLRNKDVNVQQTTCDQFQRIMALAINDLTALASIEKDDGLIWLLCKLVAMLAQRTKVSTGRQQYTREEAALIGKAFGIDLVFFDYQAEKEFPDKEIVKHTTTYVLSAKSKYFILKASQPIELLLTSSIQTYNIAKDIFQFSVPMIQKLTQVSLLFPQQVTCTICGKQCSKMQSLCWKNTKTFYCFYCVINVQVDITHIPQYQLQTYLNKLNCKITTFDMVCPNCNNVLTITNYNIFNKPISFKCSHCKSIVCAKHFLLPTVCNCLCKMCGKITFSVNSLNQKYCPGCRQAYPLKNIGNTNVQTCMTCLQCHDKELQCKFFRCHNCLAQLQSRDLKECTCRRMLCSGCFYIKIEEAKGNKIICDGI